MEIKTIDVAIKILGSDFRGLWKSILVAFHRREERWAVTFMLKGEIVETDYFDTAIDALENAIETRDR